MHEAKSNLSQLVKRAAAGEQIQIGAYGKADAVLISAAGLKPKKTIGILAGKLKMSYDFDVPLPDELQALFEGKAHQT